VGFAAAPGDGTWAIPGLRVSVTPTRGVDRLRWDGPAPGPDRPPWDGPAFGPSDRSRDGREGTGERGGGPDGGGNRGENPPGFRLRGVAVATVDLERAAGALGGLGRVLADDALLGARVATTGAARILLAEPRSEGRLAATLARRGEGPAALYVSVPSPRVAMIMARLVELGERPREGPGPFGRQVLVRTRQPWGPHLLLVAGVGGPVPGRSATIAP
jgi:hypothetical protein